jgi:hypothetical protein
LESDAGQSDAGQSVAEPSDATKKTLQDLRPASDTGAHYYEAPTFDPLEPDLPAPGAARADGPADGARSSDTHLADEPASIGGRDSVTEGDKDAAGTSEPSPEPGDHGRSSS